MEITKNKKILITVVILIIFGLFFYIKFLKNSNISNGEEGGISTNTNNTISTSTIKNINPNGGQGYTIERVPITTGQKIKAPSLDRAIIFATTSNYTQEVKDIYIGKINSLKDQIKSNPNTLLPWIDLGSYYKAIGDYQGALDAWSYVSKAAPTDFISRGNIGNLYAYYLKDNAMAEVYYKDAISKNPKQTYLYIQLAEVYRDVFKDTIKAISILDQGLKSMPNDEALVSFKSTLK